MLSKIVIDKLPRGARLAAVRKMWEKAGIEAEWKKSHWYKQQTQRRVRKELTDFERFKVMRLKKQRRFEVRKALAKAKTAA